MGGGDLNDPISTTGSGSEQHKRYHRVTGGLPSVLHGRSAERRAGNWLRRHGYRILATNFRIRGGELDLIAVKRDTLCFVEVKSRGDGSWFGAVEAIHPSQLERIVYAAQAWLLHRPHDGPCRFDIIALEPNERGAETIRHLPDAFNLDDVW